MSRSKPEVRQHEFVCRINNFTVSARSRRSIAGLVSCGLVLLVGLSLDSPVKAQPLPATADQGADWNNMEEELRYTFAALTEVLNESERKRVAGASIVPLTSTDPLMALSVVRKREIFVSLGLKYWIWQSVIAFLLESDFDMRGFTDRWYQHTFIGLGELTPFAMAGLNEREADAFLARYSNEISELLGGGLAFVVAHEMGHLVLELESRPDNPAEGFAVEKRVDEWAVNTLYRSTDFNPFGALLVIDLLRRIDDQSAALRKSLAHGTIISRGRHVVSQLIDGLEAWGSRASLEPQKVKELFRHLDTAGSGLASADQYIGQRSLPELLAAEAADGSSWSALLLASWYANSVRDGRTDPRITEREWRLADQYAREALPSPRAMYLLGWLAQTGPEDLVEAYGWYVSAAINGSREGDVAADAIEDDALYGDGFYERTLNSLAFAEELDWGSSMEIISDDIDWDTRSGKVRYELSLEYLGREEARCSVSIYTSVKNRETEQIMWDHDGRSHLVLAESGDEFVFSGTLIWDRPWEITIPTIDYSYDCW